MPMDSFLNYFRINLQNVHVALKGKTIPKFELKSSCSYAICFTISPAVCLHLTHLLDAQSSSSLSDRISSPYVTVLPRIDVSSVATVPHFISRISYRQFDVNYAT